MKRRFTLTIIFCNLITSLLAQINQKEFVFEYSDSELHGYIDKTRSKNIQGTILLIPGHGKTNAKNYDTALRKRFLQEGYNCIIYDRAGCGKSEGEYDHNQSIKSSAEEAISALRTVKSENQVSLDNLGIWSHSRGGWIAPVVINKYEEVDFWISLSGPDQLETFPYMIKKNLIIQGNSPSYASALAEEWNNFMIMLRDPSATYEEFVKVTPNIFQEPFYKKLEGPRPSRKEFYQAQEAIAKLDEQFDPATRLKIMFPGFGSIMENIDIPVLAIYGTKDTQIDWERSINFYRSTIGDNPEANLQIIILESCNHSAMRVRTGAWGENLSEPHLGVRCSEYLQSIFSWL